MLVRYDLRNEKLANTKKMPHIEPTQTLYTSNNSVVDFNADDNGIWIIHATPHSNNTIVSKINETNLEIVHSLNISIHHNKVCDLSHWRKKFLRVANLSS